MNPVAFPEANITYAETQPEYQKLPSYLNPHDATGEVISCWKPSVRERIKLLFTGKVWVHSLTFCQPLQPLFVQVDKPFKSEAA